jgi:endonuclease/exonuclease/phosphatase family metal-dependent hydrolase
MGDFNLPPRSPTLSPIRERLYDTAELFSEPLLSFPSDNPIVKIDYIFTTHDIKVLSADIPKIVASDHRPYLATIELP